MRGSGNRSAGRGFQLLRNKLRGKKKMRRSLFQMGLLILALTLFGVQTASGVVYEAPHYTTADLPGNQNVSWQVKQVCAKQGNCGQCNRGGAGCQYGPSPATKLTRGITNVITGPLELPKYLIGGVFNCNVQPLDGLGVGIVRGTSRAIERVGIGLWEVVTFPFPGFQPLLCPEYISLEPCMSNWRYGNYCEMPCGVVCNPCQGAASFMGVRRGSGATQPRSAAADRPAPAFEKQLQSQAPPPQTHAAMPGSGTSRAPVTYPDDFLK